MRVTIQDMEAALATRDRAAVNDIAARLLDQGARLEGRWSMIARALSHNGESILALKAAERGVEETGGGSAARLALARTLIEAGQPALAARLVQPMRPAGGHVELDHFRGTCELQLGNFDVARRYFRTALSLKPQSGPTWLSLALLPAVDDEALLEEMTALGGPAHWSDENAAPFLFALGTVFDRLGEHDRAFSSFAEGSAIASKNRPYDGEGDAREVEALTALDAATIEGWQRPVRGDTWRPIFVSGLPRSGTTLIEQVLTAHSVVSGGAETNFGSVAAREIGGRQPANVEAYIGAQGTLQPVTSLLLRIAGQRFGHGRFVDKSLNLSRLLGIYAAALPEAPCVWMERDPLDVAWSNFRTWFARGADWSLSLEAMAHHFALEDKLAAHWRTVLGDRWMTLSYPDLVDDPEPMIERLASHCGLDVEPAMFEPHRNARPVTSASFVQVRKPINRSGIGSAAPYARHLEPFVEAYSRSRQSLGFGD